MSGAAGQKSFSTQPFAAVEANETTLGANLSIWAGLSKTFPHRKYNLELIIRKTRWPPFRTDRL